LSWDISKDWTYDQGLGTEVEVRFIAESDGQTRVELTHTKLDPRHFTSVKWRGRFLNCWAARLHFVIRRA
jgi:hypothetical protein